MKINGKFTVDECIEINCSYPGKWKSETERIKISKAKEIMEEIRITVINVILRDVSLSFYVISFIKVNYNIKCDIF